MKSNVIKLLATMLIVGLISATGAIAAEENSITGEVENSTEKGIIINADDGKTYIVMGKNLTDMVGKTVKATGTVASGGGGNIFTVVSVEEIKKDK